MTHISFRSSTRVEECGCVKQTFIPSEYLYVEYHPTMVEWRHVEMCRDHLTQARRRTVVTMVRRRDAITAEHRRMVALRERYEDVANGQRGSLLVGLCDDVTGDTYSFLLSM